MALADIKSWVDLAPNRSISDAEGINLMLREIDQLREYAERLEDVLRAMAKIRKDHDGIQKVRDLVAEVLS